MNRCLNERALLKIHDREATAADQAHLRRCTDCSERYQRLIADLEVIGRVLEAPPLTAPGRLPVPRRLRWAPIATACAVLLVLILDAAWLRQPAPLQVADSGTALSAFTSDLSAALFASADANAMPQLEMEAPLLEAALEEGQPCTRDRVFTGECNDQFSAVLVDSE